MVVVVVVGGEIHAMSCIEFSSGSIIAMIDCRLQQDVIGSITITTIIVIHILIHIIVVVVVVTVTVTTVTGFL